MGDNVNIKLSYTQLKKLKPGDSMLTTQHDKEVTSAATRCKVKNITTKRVLVIHQNTRMMFEATLITKGEP